MSASQDRSTECTTWHEYSENVGAWKTARKAIPGEFSCGLDERMWMLAKECPLPELSVMPVLILPLRIHLVRGLELGCSLTLEECFNQLVPSMNQYWKQAGIEWNLIEVVNKEWPDDINGSRVLLNQARCGIHGLCRDPNTGMMAEKGFRRKLFLEHLIPEALQDRATYDVYIFDFIGNESQGCCISRESHTVIMGQRSTKGYPVPTARPLACLAKTMAHELGHALDLDHPKGRCFFDGTSCTARYGRDNLMTGGADRNGGGGTMLEEWQILVARESAEGFLRSLADPS